MSVLKSADMSIKRSVYMLPLECVRRGRLFSSGPRPRLAMYGIRLTQVKSANTPQRPKKPFCASRAASAITVSGLWAVILAQVRKSYSNRTSYASVQDAMTRIFLSGKVRVPR